MNSSKCIFCGAKKRRLITWDRFLEESENRFRKSGYSFDRLLMVVSPYTFWQRGGNAEVFFELVSTFGRMIFPTADMRIQALQNALNEYQIQK